MSSFLHFTGASRRQECRPRPVLRGDDIGEFWLDVASSDEPVAAESAHSPKRVLTEAFLILATAGLLAAAVTVLIPGPTF